MSVGNVNITLRINDNIYRTKGNITFDPKAKYHAAEIPTSKIPDAPSQVTTDNFYKTISEKFQSTPLT